MIFFTLHLQSNLEDEWKWQKLEEIVVQVASNKPVMLFKPTRSLFTSAVPTLENPICIHGGKALAKLITFANNKLLPQSQLKLVLRSKIPSSRRLRLRTLTCCGHSPRKMVMSRRMP